MRTSTRVPQARQDDLVVTHVDGELLVFDRRSAHIHRLDRACAAVWTTLAPNQSLSGLTATSGMESDAVTMAALAQLAKADLLVGEVDVSTTTSRRRLLRNTAVAAVIPSIVSITAPHAARAASDCTLGQTQDDPACCGRFLWCNNGSWESTACAQDTRWRSPNGPCDFSPHVDCGTRSTTC